MPSCKAVVCGINAYPEPNDLPSCVNDAHAVARLLQERYHCPASDVHMVLDRDATPERIESELKWLVSDAAANEWLFFYYSGHGYTQVVDDVMEEFLVLLDDAGQAAFWKDDRLVALTSDVPTGKLTLVMDCCYSGGLKQ